MNRILLLGCIAAGLASVAAAQPRTLSAVPGESSISYFLVHPLHHIEATSNQIASEATVDPSTRAISAVSMNVDVMTFDSGNSNRDSHAMEVVDAISYPEAKFTAGQFEKKGDSLLVSGNLTFHGVSKPVIVRSLPAWEGNSVTVAGMLDISLTEFKIERPSLLMIPVEDNLHFTLKAVYRW
jgi:polyisoprenoid-binding protein YceI